LTFENPAPTRPLPRGSEPPSPWIGIAGELTASRKVRRRSASGGPASSGPTLDGATAESLANGLYLEWYSESHGRVVLETTDYRVQISSPAWKPTSEEENQRQTAAATAFSAFLDRLTRRIERLRHEPPPDRVWDEFDYEKLLRESDARTDKLAELYEKYADRPDLDEIIAREMGWDVPPECPGTDDENLDLPDLDAAAEWEDEADELAPDPATEGIDWVRTEDGHPSHPLTLRVFHRSVELHRQCEALDHRFWEEPAVAQLVSEFQITGAKLAGALNGLAYGRELRSGPFIVATLKRALSHLHNAQEALATVTAQALLPRQICETARTEFFAIREEILRLMQEFRGHHHGD
jgi:hypothetical protein